MLGLLGFYDELDDRPGQPSGSIRNAVRPVGEPDEADLVACLDVGHVLLDVMEAGHDVITGSTHRHSPGCSSLVTDGTWLWRLGFPHYLETHHVFPARDVPRTCPRPELPDAHHRRRAVRSALRRDDAPGRLGLGCPVAIDGATLVPEPRAVSSKAQLDRRCRPTTGTGHTAAGASSANHAKHRHQHPKTDLQLQQ
ncbi:hypothetical protein ACIO53_05735 [Streptomyces sp. NPDC087305]|uniref:hypothetical protein n=1 Tax=Streptomyces sp. NPDC087305 TaxID=3365781 RepID=UPI0037F5424F